MSESSTNFKEKFGVFWSKVKDLAKRFWAWFVKIIKKIWLWLVLVVIVVTLIVGVSLYTTGIRKSLYNNSIETMRQSTEQEAKSFSDYIEKDLDAAKRLADRLCQVNADSSGDINATLGVIDSQTNSYTVTIVKAAEGINVAEGYSYSNGEAGTLELSTLKKCFTEKGVDINSPELTRAQVNSVHGILEPKDMRFATDAAPAKYITYYQALIFNQGSVAVLQEFRRVDVEFQKKFTPSIFDGNGSSYIINMKGDVLVTSDTKNDNLFTLIAGGGNADKVNELKAAMEAEKTGANTYRISNVDKVFAYSSIGNTDDWYMVSLVPSAVLTSNAEKIISTSTIFGVLIAVMVVIVILIVFLVQRNKRVIVAKEAEIQYREQLFDILANNTDEVFLMISKDGYKVEYVSPNVERILGVQPRDLKKNLAAIGKAKYVKGNEVDYETLAALPVGSSFTYETERLHKITSERRYFIETVYSVRSEQTDKLIVAISDRTEELFSRQSLEEALNIARVANKAKSAFLANMSHDIRTPMNAIVGLCSLLERDSDDKEKIKEHIKQISLSSKHMLEILNDILDMTKIESGETSLNISEVNLSDLIGEIDTIVRPQTRAKEQAFNIVVAVQEGVFLGDKIRIKRVMMNILSNAIKFTPEGGRIDFTIRQMARATKKYVRIQFIVKDTGVGMTPEFQKKIFEPFSRETTVTRTDAQGTGLGMPIAKNLVDLMGGTIAVESKPGAGTTFTVNIKFQLKGDEEESDFWSEYGIERIMTVGCGMEERETINSALADVDVAISFADGAKSALSLASKAQRDGKHYDAVLVDWTSNVEDRLTLVEGLRKILPSRAPVIAFGEHDWSESESKAIESGAVNTFMAKPFSLKAFADCIQGHKAPDKVPEGVMKGVHFLAAEDNELNAMILTELLDTVGADCLVTHNGQEALEAFEKSEEGCFDAILMDIQMPVMNGYDATRAIRSCDHPEAKTVPIIAMTANAFIEDIQNSKNAGMNAHLTKPVDMSELEKIVAQLKIKR